MASFRSPFFSLVVAIIAGVTSGQHCSVCGVGFRVGRPDAILSVQGHPDILCNRLEVAGFQGLIPIDECTSLPPLISEVCSCQANTAVERNRNRKLQSIPESNSPAAVTTKKPVTVSPVASPVVSPAYLFSGEWYCEVCDYYYESIKFPNKFVNFSNPNSTNVIQKQRCSELMGTQAACKYYATKIRRACGCEQFQAPAPAYWGSGEQPTTAEMPIGLYFFIIFSLLVLVSALCTVFKRASRLHAQERPTTVRRTPQEFSTLGHAIVVTNERREMGEEALKRRHLILSTLFPMEGKTNSGNQDGEAPASGRSLMYSEESKEYVFCDDRPEDTTCSICLESLGSEDFTVSGLCSHVYHRECIMDWMKGGHDECPNCRQSMWDPEVYTMIDQCITDQQNTSPSATAEVDMVAAC